jgi:hypothetical protein
MDQIKKNEIGGSCGTDGEGKDVHGVLVGKPEGRNHWEDLKMDLQ